MKFLQTKKGKVVMNFVYGAGASVVILGAMFKIMHWPGAGPMLVVGLSTEAVIFLISAFEAPHEELDWTLVYPELAGMPDGDGHGGRGKSAGNATSTKDSITQELDKLLEDAKIGPELIESLGNGLRKLGENTGKLADMSDAGIATDEYINSFSNAAKTVDSLSATYVKAAESLVTLGETGEDGKSYGENLKSVAKNLAALNSIYELQIQNSSEYLETTNKVYGNIAELMVSLSESIEDTKKYKNEVSKLGDNLSALNTVYGNMLTAMNVNR
jgi:gliding motility-associated protein GldL